MDDLSNVYINEKAFSIMRTPYFSKKIAFVFCIFAVLGLLSGCTSPDIDMSSAGFNGAEYSADLEACRGGSSLKVALHGLGGAVVGSAVGAFHGAYHGALAGNAPEGALIGAIVGSVAGVVVGAYEPFKNINETTEQCLGAKGYKLG